MKPADRLALFERFAAANPEPTTPFRTAQSIPRELRLVKTDAGLRLAHPHPPKEEDHHQVEVRRHRMRPAHRRGKHRRVVRFVGAGAEARDPAQGGAERPQRGARATKPSSACSS